MPPELSISRFGETDRGAWLDLWQDYVDGYESKAGDPAIAESNWQAITAADGRLHALALRHRERTAPVGFAHYVFHHSTKSVQPECYLIDLFVSESMRGHGGGRRLLDGVLADCRDKGMARVTWITKPGNDGARKLYDKLAQGCDWVRYVAQTN